MARLTTCSGRRAALPRRRPGPEGLTMARPDQTVLERQYSLLGLMLIAPTVLVFCAVIVYPLVSAIYLSPVPDLHADAGGRLGRARQLPRAAGQRASSGPRLATTLIWTVGTLTLQIVFGVGMALVLHQNIWFRSLRAVADPVSLLHLDRRGGAGLEVAVQRPLRHPQPPDDGGGPHRHAARLPGHDAQRDDLGHPGRRVEVLSLRRDRRSGPAPDDPRPRSTRPRGSTARAPSRGSST